ncbi:MAG: hypothetical protein H7Y89_01025, partial [Steroidobacteraceae bacterium]|nr:hypothetical protein [Steroidobacteraceae bacterium]
MMLKSFGQYSGEILILILFAASWLLLRIEGKGLAELGFDQPVRRWVELAAGFFITGVSMALIKLVSAWRSGATWEWNSYFILSDYLHYLVSPRVTEVLWVALVCQGYLLLLAMRFSG